MRQISHPKLMATTQPTGQSRPLINIIALICFMLSMATRPATASVITGLHTSYPALHKPATHKLVIAGPTDTDIFEQLVVHFQQQAPTVAIEYYDIGTLELFSAIEEDAFEQLDLVISSATHLQLKLVNDGYAQTYTSPLTLGLPNWAQWRNKLFGFTLEPIVLVYHQDLPDEAKPRTRSALLQAIEKDPAFWRHKTATYDIGKSGLGYLLAVFDERTSSNFWGMANALGHTATQLYPTTGEILDQVISGDAYVGYNVLGSYAMARQAQGAPLEVVIPEDYVLFFSRTAFIAKSSKQPELAGKFIDFLLSERGQEIIDERIKLGALIRDTDQHWPTESLHKLFVAPVQPITIEPGLLVSLDETRQQRFIENWYRLVTDTPELNTANYGEPDNR